MTTGSGNLAFGAKFGQQINTGKLLCLEYLSSQTIKLGTSCDLLVIRQLIVQYLNISVDIFLKDIYQEPKFPRPAVLRMRSLALLIHWGYYLEHDIFRQ